MQSALSYSSSTSPLIGQDAATSQFWQAYAGGKMAQSWIFLGPKGVGKSTFALFAARELLSGGFSAEAILPPSPVVNSLFGEIADAPSAATAPKSIHDPDHPLFRKIISRTHPDVLMIDMTPTSADARKSELTVDDLRAVASFLRGTPIEGGWRIVIIDDAERMNKNAANALLKILEEPPPRSLIILVASTIGFFPPTIRSRCRVLRFHALRDQDVLRHVERINPSLNAEDKQVLVNLSAGSIGRAERLIAADGLSVYADINRFFLSIANNAPQWHLWHDIAEKFAAQGELAQSILHSIIQQAIQADGRSQAAQQPIFGIKSGKEWLDFHDEMQQLVGKQQFLYLDGKQVWLNLMAKIAA